MPIQGVSAFEQNMMELQRRQLAELQEISKHLIGLNKTLADGISSLHDRFDKLEKK